MRLSGFLALITFTAALPAVAQDINLTATSHNYVSVQEGTSSQYGIQLTNNTSSAFPFSLSLTGNSNFTQTNSCGTSVAVSGKCEIIFTYTAPSDSEYDTATFTIAANGQTFSPSNTGTLQAHSVASGQITLSTNEHNFTGVAIGSSATFGLNVSNGTQSAVTFTFTPSGDTTDYKITSNSCTSGVAAAGQCEIIFAYTPSSTANTTYTLALADSTSAAFTPSSSLELLGYGMAAGGTLQLTTGGHNFIQVAEGATSAAYGTVLTNNTTSAVNLSYSLGDSKDFQLSTTTCGATLNAGAHCNLAFVYTPQGIDFMQTLYSITATNASGTSVPLYVGTGTTAVSGVTLRGIGQADAPEKAVIYQVVTDRFYAGNPTDFNPSESPGLYDSNGFGEDQTGDSTADWQAYWGGNLAGIQQQLPYIQGIGATAVWMSPVVNNNNLNQNSSTPVSASYHGYDARDFMQVEEHFGDANNTFAEFDSMTSAMHSDGIRLILDWANNHSNYRLGGELGALYNNGTFLGSSSNDPNNLFHHYPDISNFGDRYQMQYYTLSDLLDIDQSNPTMDSYLKTAVEQMQAHGIDGLRLDAMKDVIWGWEYSFANAVYTYGQSVNNPSPYLYGEWYGAMPSDEFWADETKYVNQSAINNLDFGVNQAVRDVFGSNNNFSELDDTINSEDTGANTGTFGSTNGYYYTYPNSLATFFDSHDENRLYGNITTDINRLHEAMAYLLTSRGVPIILYGDEQYLYNTTNSGNDPYNRVAMSSFNTSTTAYQLIATLSALRKANDAIGFGSYQQRWINSDIYAYERQFGNSVVLVAMNKNTTTSTTLSGLLTNLPAGTYTDYLGGLLGGIGLTVTGSGGNNTTNAPTLPPETVSVWVYTKAASSPTIGSIVPHSAQPGVQVTVYGDDFGTGTGTVLINGVSAPVVAWGNNFVVATVPNTSNAAQTTVQVKNSGGTASGTYPFTVLTANLVPVVITVNNACTNYGDNIFITGSTVELGNWSTSFAGTIGPMLTGASAANGGNQGESVYPTWSILTSLPAGQQVQFKFIDIRANGTVGYESGSNRYYTVPTSGVGNYSGSFQGSSCPNGY